MKERIRIADLHNHVGKDIFISGWVDVRRDHGKLIFIDIRDGSGKIQTVALPAHQEAHSLANTIRPEWVVAASGTVNPRPEKMINPNEENGDIEIEIRELFIISQSEELPFEKDAPLNLDTYLDHLPLTLRSQRSRDIFTVQTTLIQGFRNSMQEQGFMEYQNPVLVGGDGEGGASAFHVNYYDDKKALLATSPQLYKQIMVGVFERVFTTGKVFRAEKHATTRHLSEVVQMDFEMGFINDHRDVMAALEKMIKDVVQVAYMRHETIFKRFGLPKPLMPEQFPIVKLREAQKILHETFGINSKNEPDLNPEEERKICEWAKENHKSDFIFITHFPEEKRPFYTFLDADDPGYTKSFDLLFRGLEINSGSQRIHTYDELTRRIKEKGLDPEIFHFYLQAFRSGMPTHGGCSTGLERLTARLLLLDNVKEATLFPRDRNRIDSLLSY